MSTAGETALREMHLLRRNANNAIKKAHGDIDLATLTAPVIDDLKKEVEPLVDLLDKCVMGYIKALEDMEGDFSDEIEDWENELVAIQIVWEHCLDNWYHQLNRIRRCWRRKSMPGGAMLR